MSAPGHGARLAKAGLLLDRVFHDLKQPLNMIRVVAQDVRLDVKKARLQLETLPESMREIEKAVDRATASLDRLRRFAGAARDMPVERVAVGDLCHAAANRIRSDHPTVLVSEDLADALAEITANGGAMEQALWEVLDNAARAAQNASGRSPRLEVTASHRGAEIVIAVSDNGGGVADELRPRLFEPFSSGDGDGAGLGLALARALVEANGGAVVLASTGSEGSTFELSFKVE